MNENMNEKGNTLPENKEKGKKEWILQILATILSAAAVLISAFAIWSSVNIAENQNRISLFEKRYEIYQTYKALNINAKKANEVLQTQKIGNDIEVWIAFVAYIVPGEFNFRYGCFQNRRYSERIESCRSVFTGFERY